MITASQIRAGMAIRYQGQPYKVIGADYHPGQGKMGGVNHLQLRNLETGTTWEQNIRAELRIEDLPIERRNLEFLYVSDAACVFMHPQNYDQVDIPVSILGETAAFLSAGMQLPVEFVEGRPVSVVFPDFVEVVVDDTAPPSHGQVDSTWKPARLGNGVEVMVPPFVKSGDAIRLNLTTMKYMDRARAKSV
jgi:elongation factor P